MKTSTIPMICGVALAAMSGAGASHWWSVRQFVEVANLNIPVSATPAPLLTQPETKPATASTLATNQPPAKPATPAAVSGPQKEFFEALLAEVKNLRTENLNLVDQMAETNRDLMKLEFRVDTHSESFRPMPTTEERQDTSLENSLDDGSGVLPPRAEPVYPISHE
ncbi:MAG: hypothetical protein ABI162_10025 [Luteolibacter sp.]